MATLMFACLVESCASDAIDGPAVHHVEETARSEAPAVGTEVGSGAVDPNEYAPLCAASCQAHKPAPSESLECPNATVEDCAESCVDGINDLDAACADCWVGSIEWRTATGGCGEWECVCSDGYPTFSLLGCQSECASTRERRAALRLAMPEPESRGHLPTVSVAFDSSLGSVASDGQGNIWAAGHGAVRVPQLIRLTDDGEFVEAVPSPEPALPLLLSSATGLVALGPGETANSLDVWSLGFDAEPKWAYTFTDTLPYVADTRSRLMVAEQAAAVAVCSTAEVVAFSGNGSTQQHYLLPTTLQPDQTLRCAVSQEGGLFVSINTPNALARIEYWRPGWERAPELAFSLDLASSLGHSAIEILEGDDGNGAYFWGTQRRVENGVEDEDVVLGHVSEQGNLDFTWTTPELSRWSNTSFTWDHHGNVYLLSTEDPYGALTATGQDTTGLCSAWGCAGLVLRRISNTGTESWRYEHRKTSHGGDVTLTRDGRVLVTGNLHRETTTGMVMVFESEP